MPFRSFIVTLGCIFALPIGLEAGFDSPPDMFGGPQEGEEAPYFRLKTLEGRTVELGESLEKGPVVVEFGSYTCPIFRERHGAIERLREKYGGRISFFTVYTLEAHPKGDVCPYTGGEWVTPDNEREGIFYRQPALESERRELTSTARQALRMQTTILVDDMENSTWKAYGGAPNAAYLIGRDRIVKLRQGWLDPEELKKAITREIESSE